MSGEQKTFRCYFCNAVRVIVDGRCRSCLNPVNDPRNRQHSDVKPKCPRCFNYSVRETEPGRFYCKMCSSYFEPDDGFALDTRPHVNLEKRERLREIEDRRQKEARRSNR